MVDLEIEDFSDEDDESVITVSKALKSIKVSSTKSITNESSPLSLEDAIVNHNCESTF